MMRFHPLRKHKLHKHDSQLIFGSAFFLLTNLGITQYAYYASEGTLSQIPGISTLIANSKKNTKDAPETNIFGHTINIDTSGNIITPKTIFGITMGKDTKKSESNSIPIKN